MNAPRGYVVTLAATTPKGERSEHVLKVEAYELLEAVTAAFLELEGQHGFTEKGCKVKVIRVRPDSDAARAQVAELVGEMSRLMRTWSVLRPRE